MYINKSGEIKIRIHGVDQSIRWLATMRTELKVAAQVGILKAAEHLMEKIKAKFGTYQSTGGDGDGPWRKLSPDTNWRKVKKYGFKDKPLIATGKMRDSFYIKKGGKGTIAASVASKDPKLIHHIYGAPRAHLPRRDLFLVTAKEEEQECKDILKDEVYEAMSKLGW